jgi:hypothetical protein
MGNLIASRTTERARRFESDERLDFGFTIPRILPGSGGKRKSIAHYREIGGPDRPA